VVGATAQERSTVPLNPVPGITVTVETVFARGSMAKGLNCDAVTVKLAVCADTGVDASQQHMPRHNREIPADHPRLRIAATPFEDLERELFISGNVPNLRMMISI
jgi:hypothetical protein